MMGWPKPRREWSLVKKVAPIKAAGFDGVNAYATPELKAAIDRQGLALMRGFDYQDVAGALPHLRTQRFGRSLHQHPTSESRHTACAGCACRSETHLCGVRSWGRRKH